MVGDLWLGPEHVGRQKTTKPKAHKRECENVREEQQGMCTEAGRQEQSKKKQKEQQTGPATGFWTVDFMTRQGERFRSILW